MRRCRSNCHQVFLFSSRSEAWTSTLLPPTLEIPMLPEFMFWSDHGLQQEEILKHALPLHQQSHIPVSTDVLQGFQSVALQRAVGIEFIDGYIKYGVKVRDDIRTLSNNKLMTQTRPIWTGGPLEDWGSISWFKSCVVLKVLMWITSCYGTWCRKIAIINNQ